VTTAPFVELRFDPTGLRPGDLPRAGAFLGSPAEALEAALAVTRAAVVREVKEQLTGIGAPTQGQLLQIVDLAWRTAFWRYRKVSAPILADAYLRAYLAANAGDVPSSVIYNLADQHAEKVGEYFHATSREALAEGYNALVNRRVPARAAADRVMEAYGLSPRQMRGYNAATTFATPVTDQRPRPLKARAREYADKAFTSRVKKLAKQEEHNIDEQAKQFAWMWLQDKGRLNEKAQKLWITAKDERVCPVCGPLHGKKVGINERFRTKEGEFWTPGLHPNCRCVVRLIENRFSKNLAGTELKEFNELHPRAYDGRFGVKTRTKPQPKPQTKTIDVDEEFDRILATQVREPVRHITYATPAVVEPDTETDQKFAALIAAQPKSRRGLASALDSPLQADLYRNQALAEITATEPMIDFAADLAVDLRTRTRSMQETKTPVQTIKPAYAVIQHHNLKDGDIEQIKLDHGITFSTDEIAVAQEAGELIQRAVEHQTDEMINTYLENPRLVSHRDPVTGDVYYADFRNRPEIFGRIADFYGRTATSHWHDDFETSYFDSDLEDADAIPEDPGTWMTWMNRDGEKVTFQNQEGEPWWTQRMSYRELGQNYFNQSPEDYEVYVIGIDRVPTHEGAVEDISGSGTSLHREFSVDGEYTLKPNSVNKTQADHFYAATTFELEPKRSVQLDEE